MKYKCTPLRMRGVSVYEHFHSPVNEHNRFLSNATETEKFFLRDFPRYPPFTTRFTDIKERPKSSPPQRKLKEQYPDLYSQYLNKRAHQPFLYPRNQIVNADLKSGEMVDWNKRGPEYSRVLTYDHPRHTNVLKGYMREPHEDYQHYKKYGFAGKGAKTSWASNPKHRRHSTSKDHTFT